MVAGSSSAAVLAGDRRAIARMISLIESGDTRARDDLARIYIEGPSTLTIGITGAPGSGKSTLISSLVTHLRGIELSVGVVAVDPSSPFSGGALLGDRVRMQEHVMDSGVFVRSMATRGHLGGLAVAVPEALRVLQGAGFDVVIAETAGVGQSEVEVASHADTTVVVLTGGMGDGIQAAKAGILEVADVYCVNKSDKQGATATVRDLRAMLELAHGLRDPDWFPPIVKTTATVDEGIAELWAAIESHRAHISVGDRLAQRRHARAVAELKALVTQETLSGLESRFSGGLNELATRVVNRELDPYSAAQVLIDKH